MDREAFVAARRTGVGGSDIASALGLDPYRTSRELYAIKTGELPDGDDTRLTRAGRMMESAIADLYALEYGVTLRKKHVAVACPQCPIIHANVDRLIVGQRAGLECKNVDSMVHRMGGEWGEPETDMVPMRYLLQSLTYAMCFDYPVWYIGALVGGNDLKRYVIRRDAELEALIVDGVVDFWSHVDRREPPPLDYTHPAALRFLKRLYPGTNGETITLDADALHWHAVGMQADERAKHYEAVSNGARAHLLDMVGPNAVGLLPDGSGSYRRKEVARKGYEVAPTTYMDFRFVKPKGGSDERVAGC
ncbi:YqaJ viral recombinase family nuclease [Paraburkholderia caribensis]|uniref:YqaJ viral recombinase family nuclease n=1 Tax=Paraburkholderia caribensis TaxID=75105 RepID=UPI0028591279|nr:YqaJ viral recombinase family protein [Paraburkholderia caribensis]MDR6384959.1 putative phage-type endonuclease [Paraburkholderia caribensis]